MSHDCLWKKVYLYGIASKKIVKKNIFHKKKLLGLSYLSNCLCENLLTFHEKFQKSDSRYWGQTICTKCESEQ